MKIAFLILTYGNPLFHKKIKKLSKKYNIYIHPKFANEVDNYFKKYIIKDIVETKWGDFSIVQATLNMLTVAYADNNDYYFLISGDSCPLYNQKLFSTMFSSNNNDISSFDFMKKYDNIYKSSQWWMMIKQDVSIILNTTDKYKNFFLNKRLDGAYDENYFLTVLQNEIKDYKYKNTKVMYVRWLHMIITRHPFIFNKLTQNDIIDIAKEQSYFIRKCLPTFSKKVYKTKENLLCIYIGTETNQDYLNNFDFIDADLCILTPLNINEINNELLEKCVYVIPIIWRFYEKTIISIIVNMKNILRQWERIIFVPELFTFNDIKLNRKLLSLPKINYMFNMKVYDKIINKKIFMTMIDNKNNK